MRVPELGVCRDTLVKQALSVVTDDKAQQHSAGGREQITPRGSQRSQKAPSRTESPTRRAGSGFLLPALACKPPPQGLEARGVPAPHDADAGQADAHPALTAGPQAEEGPQVQRHGQGRLRARRSDVREGEGSRAGAPGGDRLLTLPCTTACSPWRITFPGADSTRLRSHISRSRTRPEESRAAASAAQLQSRGLTAPLTNRSRALPRPPGS